MRIDQHSEHAKRFVVFDESHASHIGGKVVNFSGTVNSLLAGSTIAQIEGQILNVVEALIPFLSWLEINRPDGADLIPAQFANQPAADESAGSANRDFKLFHVSLAPNPGGRISPILQDQARHKDRPGIPQEIYPGLSQDAEDPA